MDTFGLSCPECGRTVGDVAVAQCPDCRADLFDTVGAAPAERDTEKMPRQIGRYEILGKIGEGGMGVVYRARHTELNRIVAIKVMIAGEHAGETQIRRFEREARAAAGLQHPNLIQVFDIGREGSLCYFVMEYVQAPSLEALIRDKRISIREAMTIARDVARALAYAHQQGVIHRDIKPSNILVSPDGTARIVDFGLAKSYEDMNLTASGEIIGTPHYMPPEQIEGMAEVDARSDIYALGTCIYEMITGRPPFRAETVMAIMRAIQDEDPVAPGRVTQVARDVETICMKAMAREKQRRYQTAQELVEDIERYLEGLPIQARRSGAFYHVTKFVRRRAAAVAAAAAILAAVGVGVYFFVQAQIAERRADEERQKREQARIEARPFYDRGMNLLESARMATSKERRAVRRRDLEQAVAEFTQALALFPDYADAALGRAQAEAVLDRLLDALRDASLAAKKDPKLSDAYFLRILLTYQIEHRRQTVGVEAALGLHRETLSFPPGAVAAMRDDLDRLRTLGTSAARTLTAEAALLICEGRHDEADDVLKRAIDENGRMAEPRELRAYVLQILRDPQQALEELDFAVDLDPNVSKFYLQRALILARLGHASDARRDADEVVALAPDSAESYVHRGLVLLLLGDMPAMLEDLTHALQMNPHEPFALFFKTMSDLLVPGRIPPEKALETIARIDAAIAKVPESGMLYMTRGLVRLRAGDADGAQRDFDTFLGQFAEEERADLAATLANYRGLVTGKFGTAQLLEDADRLLADGRTVEARALYQQGLRQLADPRIVADEGLDDATVRRLKQGAAYNLACCCALMGDAEGGFENLERALEAGFDDFDHIDADPDLDLLRQQEERYDALLDRFERGF